VVSLSVSGERIGNADRLQPILVLSENDGKELETKHTLQLTTASVPPSGANKSEEVICGLGDSNVHASIQLPILCRLIKQSRIEGADPAAVRLGANIGSEFYVGAQFLGNRVPETDRIKIIEVGTASRFMNRLDRAFYS